MASSLLPPVLKCGQCRHTLQNVRPPQPSSEASSQPDVIPVVEDDSAELPKWIQDKIEESGWTKGKLSCPHCQARIGGFDFVGRHSAASIPIYLVRSKVDVHTPRDLEQIRADSRSANWPPPPNMAAESPATPTTPSSDQGSTESLFSSPSSNSSSPSSFSDEMTPLSSSDTSSSVGASPGARSTDATTNTSDDGGANADSSDWTDDDDNGNSADDGSASSSAASDTRQRRRRRSTRRERRRRVRARREPADMTLKKAVMTKEQEKVLEQILSAEPELDAVDDSLVCPVCLDMLHEPFTTLPCRHTFCEPCLRRLGSKSPMNTLCPMCRTLIVYCDHDKGKSRLIQKEHKSLYLKRKEFERSSNVYGLPLPWRPGWRNLVLGRAMGGNNFRGESYSEYLLRILQQIPYYVPPVLIANLVNLLLFVFLLGAVEVMPVFLATLTGRHYPTAPTTAATANAPSLQSAAAGGSAGAHGFVGHGGAGQSPAGPPSAKVGMSEAKSDLEKLREFARHVLSEDNPEDITLPPTYMPAASSHHHPHPDITGLAWDATFYYVLGTMSLVAAAFGNFILIHQQPALGILPPNFMERFYRRLGDIRRLRRMSDLVVVLALSLFPLFLLPLLLPLPHAESSWIRPVFPFVAELFLSAVEALQSYVTLTTVVVVGAAYWFGSVYLDYDDEAEQPA